MQAQVTITNPLNDQPLEVTLDLTVTGVVTSSDRYIQIQCYAVVGEDGTPWLPTPPGIGEGAAAPAA